MRDILISSAVCVACLLLAFASQLMAPSTAEATSAPARAAFSPAAGPTAAASVAADPGENVSTLAAPFELDPDDPNPTLFTMAPSRPDPGEPAAAPSVAEAGAAALGGEMVAPKERMTPTGLRITDLVVGEGAEALSGQNVVVHYRGTLENGIEFDSSYGRGPFTFPLGGGRVIPGWDEGVVGMKVGGKRRLVIPPDLAYGSRGAGGVIPPDATLIFEIELLRVGG